MSEGNDTVVSASQNNDTSEKAIEAGVTEIIPPNNPATLTPGTKTISTKPRQTVQKTIVPINKTRKESDQAGKTRPSARSAIVQKRTTESRPSDEIPSSPRPARKKRSVLNAFFGRYGSEFAHNLMEDIRDVEQGIDDHDRGSDDSDEEHDQDDNDYGQDHHDNNNDHGAKDGSTGYHHSHGDFSEKSLASVLQSKRKSPHKSPINRSGITSDESKVKEKPLTEVREVSLDGDSDVASAKSNIFYSTIWLNFSEYFIKAINICIPLLFIVHGILHILTIGHPIGSPLETFTESLHSAVITMWSLAFAAIVGQTLKAYATWKAERGIRLMSLEQLLHSQSFSSAIKQPLLLRQVDFYSLSLFLLWTLSPLTNQAIQKMPIQVPNTQSQVMDISYIAPTGSIDGSLPQGYNTDVFEPIFGAAVLSYISKPSVANQDSGIKLYQDGWQNPKVPALSTKISDFGSAANTTWVDAASFDYNYMSLIGIPVIFSSDMPGPGNISSIFVNASYFVFECTTPNTSTPAIFNKTNSDGNVKFPSTSSTASQTLWLSYTDNSPENHTGPTSGVFEWASVKNFTDLIHTDCSELDGSGTVNCYPTYHPDNNTQFVYSSCLVKAVGIENNISCNDDMSCMVQAARIVPDAPFANLPMNGKTQDFVKTYSGNPGSSATTISEAFVADPVNVLQYLTTLSKRNVSDDLLKLDDAKFTLRIQTMWNAFYALYYANDAYLEGTSEQAPGVNQTSGLFLLDEWVYDIQPGWTTLYLLSSLLLLVLAIADIVLEVKTISPDFLGFASSVVRNNQRLNKQFRGSNLNGMQKTRAMGNMEVMIQDVNSAGDVGKIALAPSVASSVRLRGGRKYGT